MNNRKSEEEHHYESLLAYFKHLVWAIGIFVTLAGAVAGWLFHRDFEQVKREAVAAAVASAKEQANEASQKEINNIFKDDTHLQKFIESTMSSIVDTKLADIGRRIEALTNQLNEVAPRRLTHTQQETFAKLVNLSLPEMNQTNEKFILELEVQHDAEAFEYADSIRDAIKRDCPRVYVSSRHYAEYSEQIPEGISIGNFPKPANGFYMPGRCLSYESVVEAFHKIDVNVNYKSGEEISVTNWHLFIGSKPSK